MLTNERLCPYCGVRTCGSDDHIFPEFLGGQTTIRTCKPCNDLFGHAFEGPVSNDFASTVVMLRRGGIRSPRRVVWKRAIQKDGLEYDLDSDLQLTPAFPSIERDETGSIKGAVFAGPKAARGFLRGQEAGGRKFKTSAQITKGIDLRNLNYTLKIGLEVRRLAIKLAVASAQHMGFNDKLVDDETKNFLLGHLNASSRVRVDFMRHEGLEKIRPPLSHFVFVKGNSETHNSYAIVQFYGLFQLYVLLNEGGFASNDFAIVAALDVAKGYQERFEKTELLKFPMAPVTIGQLEFQQLQSAWMKKWNAEAQAVLQDDAKLTSFGIPI